MTHCVLICSNCSSEVALSSIETEGKTGDDRQGGFACPNCGNSSLRI